MKQALPLAAALFFTGSLAGAQFAVQINEVLYNPTGPDAGLQRIELYNADVQEANLFGYTLGICYPGTLLDNRTYWPFPTGFKIPPMGYVTVHYLTDGVDTNFDFFTGTSGAGFTCVTPPKLMDNSEGSVVLFDTTDCAQFSNPVHVIDFVQWGGQTHHDVQAHVAGVWQTGTFVEAFPEGRSMSYDGDGDAVEDWWADKSPTIGLFNGSPGNPFEQNYGAGCAGTPGVPAMATAGGPSAMGNESYKILVEGALAGAPAIVGLGSNNTTLPLFGCTLLVDPATLILQLVSTVDPGGTATFPLPVPDDLTLLGAPLFLQGVVIDAGSPSGVIAFSDGLNVAI